MDHEESDKKGNCGLEPFHKKSKAFVLSQPEETSEENLTHQGSGKDQTPRRQRSLWDKHRTRFHSFELAEAMWPT